jgi:flagellar hook-length control protein FliK
MHTNTLIDPSRSANAISSSAQSALAMSASTAQGFAQIMHAFDYEQDSTSLNSSSQDLENGSGNEPSVTDDSKLSSTSQAEERASSEDSSSQSVSEDADSDQSIKEIANQDSNGTSGSTDAKSDSAADQGAASDSDVRSQSDIGSQIQENQGSSDLQTQVGKEGTQTNESTLRLLENQSEQAKLSIKGLVRSLAQTTSPDLTAVAVDTRLGEIPLSQSSSNQHSTSVAARPVESQPIQQTQINQAPTGSVNQQPALETHLVQDPDLLNLKAIQNTPIVKKQAFVQDRQVDTVTEVARVDGAQGKAQRVDAGVVVTQQISSLINPTQASTHAQTDARTQQALVSRISSTTVEAITQSTSTNVGQGQPDSGTSSGSLVEKLNESAIPSESRRASVMAQVQRGLASLMRSGNSEMTMKLTPGHLGEIKIQIKTQGDQLGIRFEASSKEATSYLSSSIKELAFALRSKGLEPGEIQIEQAKTNDQPGRSESLESNDSPSEHSSSNQNPQDQNTSSSDHDRGSKQSAADPIDNESEINNEPESIWTDIGLDATA